MAEPESLAVVDQCLDGGSQPVTEHEHAAAERRAEEVIHKRYESAAKAWAKEEFRALPRDEQEQLMQEAADKLRTDIPEEHLRRAWGSDFDTKLRESARAHAVSRYRSRFPVTREQWRAGVRTADSRPTT